MYRSYYKAKQFEFEDDQEGFSGSRKKNSTSKTSVQTL